MKKPIVIYFIICVGLILLACSSSVAEITLTKTVTLTKTNTPTLTMMPTATMICITKTLSSEGAWLKNMAEQALDEAVILTPEWHREFYLGATELPIDLVDPFYTIRLGIEFLDKKTILEGIQMLEEPICQ